MVNSSRYRPLILSAVDKNVSDQKQVDAQRHCLRAGGGTDQFRAAEADLHPPDRQDTRPHRAGGQPDPWFGRLLLPCRLRYS